MPARSGSSPPAGRCPTGEMRCGPSWTDEEAADAVAGAVGVIEPGLPQMAGGRSCRAGCRACPWGRRARASAIWPLSTRVKRSRISAVGVADRDGAGDVGGAVGILAARIDQIERVRLERAVGLLARPGSGRSRRSGPAPEIVSNDRSRRSPLSLAELLQLVGRRQLVDARPWAPRPTASGGSARAPRRRAPARRGGRRSRPRS